MTIYGPSITIEMNVWTNPTTYQLLEIKPKEIKGIIRNAKSLTNKIVIAHWINDALDVGHSYLHLHHKTMQTS